MSLTKTTVLTAAAAIAALTMTGGAFAKTIEAIYTVSIHSKATKKSSVVDKLFEGEHVKINTCDDDWCLIIHDGPDGWVPLASLETVGGGSSGPGFVIQGGFGFGGGHNGGGSGNGGIIVDPVPPKHHPPFGAVTNVGNLPVSVLDPGTGGGNGGNGGNGGGNGGFHPVYPVFPVNGGTVNPTPGTGCVKFCGTGGFGGGVGPIHQP